MTDTVVKALVRLLALGFGLLWGFFVAFNVVFSDVFGISEMVGAVMFVLTAYLGIGLVFGAVGPKTGLRYTAWLAAPGTLFVLLTLGDNPSRLAYTLGVVAAVVGGTFIGVWLGVLVRTRIDDRRRRGAGDAAPMS